MANGYKPSSYVHIRTSIGRVLELTQASLQTLMCTKVSICYFLLRLQKLSISKQLIRPIQAAIVVLIVSNIVLTLMWILQCIPAWATWDIGVKGKCLDKQILMNVILAQAVISVISDFALALYPILILWKVRLNFRDKAGLCLLMGLGVLTVSTAHAFSVRKLHTDITRAPAASSAQSLTKTP